MLPLKLLSEVLLSMELFILALLKVFVDDILNTELVIILAESKMLFSAFPLKVVLSIYA